MMDSDHQSHQALEDISGVEDATKRQSKYQEFILRAIQNEDIESCKSYVDHGEYYLIGDARYRIIRCSNWFYVYLQCCQSLYLWS